MNHRGWVMECPYDRLKALSLSLITVNILCSSKCWSIMGVFYPLSGQTGVELYFNYETTIETVFNKGSLYSFCRTRFWVVVVEVWLVICVLYLYKLQTTVPTDRSQRILIKFYRGPKFENIFFCFQSVDWRRYWIFGRLWAVSYWYGIRRIAELSSRMSHCQVPSLSKSQM